MTISKTRLVGTPRQQERAAALIEAVTSIDGLVLERHDDCKAAAVGADLYIFACDNHDGSDSARIIDAVRGLRCSEPLAAILVAGDELTEETILQLLAAGASDYVALPAEAAELRARVAFQLGRFCSARSQVSEQRILPTADCIGSSESFVRQIGMLPTFAASDAGVLITGETGTGKEVCAQAIHYLSARASRPWVAVNCGAVPAELIESELFGHVRGSFTNAHVARQGLVREAEGGTLFLDDVDCLPLMAQPKLLRFLQESEYRQVGANGVQHADVRVIAASNRHLPQMVAQGTFRQDLYYRLNVLSLRLPPLRERRADVAALALFFIRKLCQRMKRAEAGLSSGAVHKLLSHDWPGNVRELKHVIERALIVSTSQVLGEADIDLPDDTGGAAAQVSLRSAKAQVVAEFERSFIEQLLTAHRGNVTHAALSAGKNRRAFFALMRKYRIEAARFRESEAQAS